MNNSIFKSIMRIIMIVLYYHQHKKKQLHAVQSWKKGKVLGLWTDWSFEIHRRPVGDFWFPFSFFFFSFLFSNEYFLIIIYIKYVPNRLFCWMILSIIHLSGLCPIFIIFFSFDRNTPVCSQILEYQEPMPLSCRLVCRRDRPVACFPAMLFVAPLTSAGSPPPFLRSQARHQPLAGNRSESRWVTTVREGESSASHVSKVDREILCSTTHTRKGWRDVSRLTGWRIFQRYD